MHGRHSNSQKQKAAAHRGREALLIVVIVAAGSAALFGLVKILTAWAGGHGLWQQLGRTDGTVFKTVAYGLLYIISSAALINFNKYLMAPGRFPFAASLTLLQAASGSVLSTALWLVRPSLFPSLAPGSSGVVVDRWLFLLNILPISVCFGGVLLLGTTAYLYCSVAFVQFMKEFNVVLVYLLAVVTLLEVASTPRWIVILAIAGATYMCIKGEMSFSLLGFLLLVASGLLDAMRVTLQGLALQGSKRLDPMSFVALVMPPLTIGLLIVQIVSGLLRSDFIQIAMLRDYLSWWHMLLPNCLLAYALNISVSLFLGHSGPVAYTLCGIVKDSCIVLADVFVLGEPISGLQVAGYTLQIILISLFSTMKMFPDDFEHGLSTGVRNQGRQQRETWPMAAPRSLSARRPTSASRQQGAEQPQEPLTP